MTDPDDEAFSWEGERPARPADRPVRTRATVPDDAATNREAGRSAGLLALGVLAGVAVIETAFWLRSALLPSIAASVDPGSGTVPETIAYAANLAGRVLAVAAPLVWFGAVAWRVRTPSKRLAWLVLGAVLLVPWPAVLAAS